MRLAPIAAMALAILAATVMPALADFTFRSMHLVGASPTLTFGPPSVPGAQADYIYTNHGDGTVRLMRGNSERDGHEDNPGARLAVLWSYREHGSAFSASAGQIDDAAYTITGARALGSHPLILHVIPSTYKLHYDNPATAPCSTGSFSYAVQEDASVNGTFAPLITSGGCFPTYSLDIFVVPGGLADRAFNDDGNHDRGGNHN
ncbi:MAG: hypothetical protein QOF51_4170 [Chloroflexota bacterium]|jgi:hypothetical protein|nr:hypothetical protein [Chloroflexota bacterium]